MLYAYDNDVLEKCHENKKIVSCFIRSAQGRNKKKNFSAPIQHHLDELGLLFAGQPLEGGVARAVPSLVLPEELIPAHDT